MKHTHTLTVLALASVLAFTGCGGSEKAAPQNAAAAAPADGRRVIAVTADDTMKFNITELRAKPGEPLRVSLKNTGRMPKQAMAHNWVLLRSMSDSEATAFGVSASTSAPTYLPADKSAVLAHTKLLGPGESDSIDFNAPSAPGTYPFLCTFPGHSAIMKGKLVVE